MKEAVARIGLEPIWGYTPSDFKSLANLPFAPTSHNNKVTGQLTLLFQPAVTMPLFLSLDCHSQYGRKKSKLHTSVATRRSREI